MDDKINQKLKDVQALNKPLAEQKIEALTIEISELPTSLYSRIKYQGRLWDYQATERDGEGEIIFWLFTDTETGKELIIFND